MSCRLYRDENGQLSGSPSLGQLRDAMETRAAPDISTLAKRAAPFEVSQVLAEPAEGDFLCLDDAGQITAAYPFSAVPTPHRVRISGGRPCSPCVRSTPWACPR
jgi:hypothetical protein